MLRPSVPICTVSRSCQLSAIVRLQQRAGRVAGVSGRDSREQVLRAVWTAGCVRGTQSAGAFVGLQQSREGSRGAGSGQRAGSAANFTFHQLRGLQVSAIVGLQQSGRNAEGQVYPHLHIIPCCLPPPSPSPSQTLPCHSCTSPPPSPHLSSSAKPSPCHSCASPPLPLNESPPHNTHPTNAAYHPPRPALLPPSPDNPAHL